MKPFPKIDQIQYRSLKICGYGTSIGILESACWVDCTTFSVAIAVSSFENRLTECTPMLRCHIFMKT